MNFGALASEQFEIIALISLAFAFGGLLKGAVGAGAPIVAVPLMVLLYDVPFAITIFVVPNIVPNLLQVWKFRKNLLHRRFMMRFAGAGLAGAALGTFFLSILSTDVLSLSVASITLIYVVFRLYFPKWVLSYERALVLCGPAGFFAGILHGSTGISAPASITFLNAMGLERAQFIASISVFFLSLATFQVPLLIYYGFLTPDRFLLSTLALIPLILFMPVGSFLMRYISREVFDRLILVLLAGLAFKIIADVVI